MGEIAGSMRWVRKWKQEGLSKKDALERAKSWDIPGSVVDALYKTPQITPDWETGIYTGRSVAVKAYPNHKDPAHQSHEDDMELLLVQALRSLKEFNKCAGPDTKTRAGNVTLMKDIRRMLETINAV